MRFPQRNLVQLIKGGTRRARLAIEVMLEGDVPTSESRKRPEVPPITDEEVSEAKAFFPREKFFIFGHARSGTTLLVRLIRLHPEVHCDYQAHFFTRPPLLKALVRDAEVAAWLSRGSFNWNRGRDLSPVILRAVSDFVLERDARREGKCVVGDKSPNHLNGESVCHLHDVYPDARLIFIVRDGRDAILSRRFQQFIERPQDLSAEDASIYDEFARRPERFLQGERSLFTEEGMRRAAEGWKRNVIETEQKGSELFGGKYLHLRYEDLLRRPLYEMERVWSFLDVNPSIAGLKESIAAELDVNPVAEWQQQKNNDLASLIRNGDNRVAWQDLFTPRDREIFKELAGEALIAWGYEKDLNW